MYSWDSVVALILKKEIRRRHYIFNNVGKSMLVKCQGVFHLILISKYYFYFEICAYHDSWLFFEPCIFYKGWIHFFTQRFSKLKRSCQHPENWKTKKLGNAGSLKPLFLKVKHSFYILYQNFKGPVSVYKIFFKQ